MDRRTFIYTASAAGLSATSRYALAERQEAPSMLVKLLEDSSQEQLPAALVTRIRQGLTEQALLAALCTAAARNVQPYPSVGFKYHALMVLRSIYLTAAHLPTPKRWVPFIWAADYFKSAQAEERASSGGWHMSDRALSNPASPEHSRQALAEALDRWDLDAADAALVNCVRGADPRELFPLLFTYGARDLRDLGHKAITVACVHGLVQHLGTGEAVEGLLRSTVAALLNSDGEPNPATHDLAPDRPWRRNLERIPQIPASWRQGHDDSGARTQLRAALYHSTPEEAGGAVVELLQKQIAPEAIWEVFFETAAEVLIHDASIVPVHAQTSANALHYAYRMSPDVKTQQLALLQCAAHLAMFCQMTRQISRKSASEVSLSELQPLPFAPTGDALEEIFADLAAGQRMTAVRKSFGYLGSGGDTERLIAMARHHLVRGAREAHDYKLAEAVFENQAQGQVQGKGALWRARFLAAGMVYFIAPAREPSPLVSEVLQRLGA